MDGSAADGRRAAEYSWSVRVNWVGNDEAKAFSGNHSFSVGRQASFTSGDAHPSAVEYLLGALGGDLVNGFYHQAAKRGLSVTAVESVVSGELDNPLVFLGVIGANGRPGLGSIAATVYVSADADEAALDEAWHHTLATSPLVSTLERSVKLSLRLQIVQ